MLLLSFDNISFFQAEDGIRDRSPSRGLGDVYKRQILYFKAKKRDENLYLNGFSWSFGGDNKAQLSWLDLCMFLFLNSPGLKYQVFMRVILCLYERKNPAWSYEKECCQSSMKAFVIISMKIFRTWNKYNIMYISIVV